jgi:DNA-binding MarR family transcriptional regulator
MLQANKNAFQEIASAVLGTSHLLMRQPLHGDPEPAAFAVLAALCRGAASRPSELVSAVRLDLSTISRHVKSLETDGYLVKVRDPEDGRSCRLKVTAAGRAIITKSVARRAELFRRATAHWDPRDLRTLVELLTRLAGDLKSWPGAWSRGRTSGREGIPPARSIPG